MGRSPLARLLTCSAKRGVGQTSSLENVYVDCIKFFTWPHLFSSSSFRSLRNLIIFFYFFQFWRYFRLDEVFIIPHLILLLFSPFLSKQLVTASLNELVFRHFHEFLQFSLNKSFIPSLKQTRKFKFIQIEFFEDLERIELVIVTEMFLRLFDSLTSSSAFLLLRFFLGCIFSAIVSSELGL